jgi:hypothetical protein
MQEVIFSMMQEDFGGQNQIVNEQDQNREVNAGGLTQTDSEKTLYGPLGDLSDNQEKLSPSESEKSKEEVEELPARFKKMETLA